MRSCPRCLGRMKRIPLPALIRYRNDGMTGSYSPNPNAGVVRVGSIVTCSCSGRKIVVSSRDDEGNVWEVIPSSHPSYAEGEERFIGSSYEEFEPMLLEHDRMKRLLERVLRPAAPSESAGVRNEPAQKDPPDTVFVLSQEFADTKAYKILGVFSNEDDVRCVAETIATAHQLAVHSDGRDSQKLLHIIWRNGRRGTALRAEEFALIARKA